MPMFYPCGWIIISRCPTCQFPRRCVCWSMDSAKRALLNGKATWFVLDSPPVSVGSLENNAISMLKSFWRRSRALLQSPIAEIPLVVSGFDGGYPSWVTSLSQRAGVCARVFCEVDCKCLLVFGRAGIGCAVFQCQMATMKLTIIQACRNSTPPPKLALTSLENQATALPQENKLKPKAEGHVRSPWTLDPRPAGSRAAPVPS